MKSIRQTTVKSIQRYQSQSKRIALPLYHSYRPIRTMRGTNNMTRMTAMKTPTYQLNRIQQRQITSVLGSGVMSNFIKSSYLFWGLPVSAILSPYINPLPFDALFGTLLPYHCYVGLNHIFTDYLPQYAFAAYVVAGIMFLGLQNSNFNGEGMSKSVRRLFVSSPIENNVGKQKQVFK